MHTVFSLLALPCWVYGMSHWPIPPAELTGLKEKAPCVTGTANCGFVWVENWDAWTFAPVGGVA